MSEQTEETAVNGASQVVLNETDIPRLMMNVASTVLGRQQLSQQLGSQHDGKRNVYEAAGYKQIISYEDYLGKYSREGVAGRLVRAPAHATWRVPPEIYNIEGEETPFNTAITELTDTEVVPLNIEEARPNLWSALAMGDELAGIGRYGVIVLGINDGGGLDTPLKKVKDSESANLKRLLYMTPLPEGQATIDQFEMNKANGRFGKPIMYTCDFGDGGSTRVHWSRIVHIAENAPGVGVYGVPRLMGVFNHLEDLLKVMAGSGESAWRLLFKGIVASTKDGYKLADENDETEDKIDEYIHEFKRFLLLEGMDVKIEGGEIVDPTGLVTIIIALISAATGYPQRLLLGSERGELASSQDEVNWKELIESRQTQFAEIKILRDVLNRLIYCGVLPMPENGRYTVKWPSLFTLTDAEQASLNKDRAEVLAKLSPAGAADAYTDGDEVRELAMLPPRGETAVMEDDILDEEDTAVEPIDETAVEEIT